MKKTIGIAIIALLLTMTSCGTDINTTQKTAKTSDSQAIQASSTAEKSSAENSLTETTAPAFTLENSSVSNQMGEQIRFTDTVYGFVDKEVLFLFSTNGKTHEDKNNPDEWGWFAKALPQGIRTIVVDSSITEIGRGAFHKCNTIESFIIPDSVSTICADAFVKCTNLKTITIPSRVTKIADGAFAYCSGLESIELPEGLLEIGEYAFRSCSNLKQINLPKSVNRIAQMAFYECTSLEEIVIPEGVKVIEEGCFGYCENLFKITIPEGVNSIREYALGHCSALKKLDLPDSVTELSEGSLSECYNLTDLRLPAGIATIKEDHIKQISGSVVNVVIPEGVRNIEERAFSYCKQMQTIFLPNSIETIGDEAFYGCEKLRDITIPAGVTVIGIRAFDGCASLANLTVSSQNPSYCSEDGVLFDKNKRILLFCSRTKIGPYSIPNSVSKIMSYSFDECRSLTEVIIPYSVSEIGVGAFSDCSSLISITIPGSVANISDVAFWGCESLREVTLQSGIQTIGEGAFGYCFNLEQIRIPTSLQSIDKSAFQECSNLTIYFDGSQEQWELIDKTGDWAGYYDSLFDTPVEYAIGSEKQGDFQSSKQKGILLTSFGQAAEGQTIHYMLSQQESIPHDYDPLADVTDIVGYDAILITVGGSNAGISAAGTTKELEINRMKEILAHANVPIVCIHIGGKDRRGPLTDELLSIILPSCSIAIVLEEGDYDGFFSNYAEQNNITMILLQSAERLPSVLMDILK